MDVQGIRWQGGDVLWFGDKELAAAIRSGDAKFNGAELELTHGKVKIWLTIGEKEAGRLLTLL